MVDLWGSFSFHNIGTLMYIPKMKKKKKTQKFHDFLENMISIGNGKFYLWLREYS